MEFKTILYSQNQLTGGDGQMHKTSCLSRYLQVCALEGTGYNMGVE